MSFVDVPNISGQTKSTVPVVNSPKAETVPSVENTSLEQSEEMLPFALLQGGDLEEVRAAWLNFASEDTLRDLWDTPDEDAAWRDLLKEI